MPFTNPATLMPWYGQPNVFGLWFRDTSGNVITNWTGAASQISLDGAGMVAGPVPTEISGSGVGYMQFTGPQMQAGLILGIATITNANWTARPFEIRPFFYQDIPTRWDARTPLRFEDLLVEIVRYHINENTTQGGQQTVYTAGGVPAISGGVSQNDLAVVRNKLV